MAGRNNKTKVHTGPIELCVGRPWKREKSKNQRKRSRLPSPKKSWGNGKRGSKGSWKIDWKEEKKRQLSGMSSGCKRQGKTQSRSQSPKELDLNKEVPKRYSHKQFWPPLLDQSEECHLNYKLRQLRSCCWRMIKRLQGGAELPMTQKMRIHIVSCSRYACRGPSSLGNLDNNIGVVTW